MHANPDADALGSSLGFAIYLRNTGHKVEVISPTGYPNFLNWMPQNETVKVFSESACQEVEELFEEADLVFCLDFSGLSRVRDMREILSS